MSGSIVRSRSREVDIRMKEHVSWRMRRLRIPIVALLTLPVAIGDAEAALAKKPRPEPVVKERMCTTVNAVATGFGKENVSNFAYQNLARIINGAKDKLAAKGAKGFRIEEQRVSCEDFIDFGGAIGREHKCQATARLCGQRT
jgi:hypothetical protein